MPSRPVPPPVHPIRLRGPWEWTPDPAGSAGEANPARVTLPHVAPLPGALLRRFNTPTGLDDGERVLLRVETLPPDAAVTLNDSPVPTAAPLAADVTAVLRPEGGGANLLRVRVPAGGTVDGVRLNVVEVSSG